ncbi:MAG TPA: UDP-N-acetylmuramate dehydrogenase [Clostridiales bacterium]|jgi:UDP-N-acetylmuramate dehydrogenase|nr:UDP-N-acetylmuramate dehydrogenase [Clostridiales bacterium]
MSDYTNLCAALESAGVEHIKDAPLCEYSTFRVGGPAALLSFPVDEAGLLSAIRAAVTYKTKFIVIGNGSNILFSDDGFDGLVISTQRLRNIEICGNTLVAGCGAPLSAITRAAARAGLSGLEFAHGIPGSCGGAVFMNAGAYGSEISDVLRSVRCYDVEAGVVCGIPAPELGLAYRHSVFMDNDRLVILSAEFCLEPGETLCIEARMSEIINKRRASQPLEYPSAGSVFKRRPGYYMGKIIEESGLKGCRIGGAAVSEKHAGFIVNTGGASARDVLALVEHIKAVILKNYGFEPECEIRFVGR